MADVNDGLSEPLKCGAGPPRAIVSQNSGTLSELMMEEHQYLGCMFFNIHVFTYMYMYTLWLPEESNKIKESVWKKTTNNKKVRTITMSSLVKQH